MSDPIESVIQQCKAERSHEPLKHFIREYSPSGDDWDRIFSALIKFTGRPKDPDKPKRDARKIAFKRDYHARKAIEGYGKQAARRAKIATMNKFPDIPENIADALIRGGNNKLSKAAKIPTEY